MGRKFQQERGEVPPARGTAAELPGMRLQAAFWLVGILVVAGALWALLFPFRGADDLLLVGYDSSRDYITEASRVYLETHPEGGGRIQAHHAGSVQQAENLARGLAADIVFLASRAEMETVESRTGCLDPDWAEAFPDGSSPVYSTIVMLVRKGNPRGISQWEDIHRREVRAAMPDPRWSGAGRYAYLALLADSLSRHGKEAGIAEKEVRELMMRLDLVPLGAHAALDVFMRSAHQDVFLTWESEALRVTGFGERSGYEIIHPAASILAKPVVAIMACQTGKRNTTDSAREFIAFLFSAEGQRIAVQHGLRPRNPAALAGGHAAFACIELQDVERLFGNWEEVWDRHLGPEGSFAYAMKLRAAREGGFE
ncbi:MAG: sulfate ABC transporter substrate-binding protein [Oceanipulchritudo sp.]